MQITKCGISLIVALCMCLGLYAQNVNAAYEDGGLYIKLKDNSKFEIKSGENRTLSVSSFPFLRNNTQKFGLQNTVKSMSFGNNPILSRTISITIDSIEKIDEFIELISQNPLVEYVEKRPIYYTCAVKAQGEHLYNDPLYGTVDGTNHGWHLDILQADSAWTIATGKPHIKVAVVDNAVWAGHEDLQIASENLYNVATRQVGNASPPASTNQDANCPSLNNCPSYLWSHGTHCAGNVGAINNNGIGMASIGGGVTLMGVSCPATNPSSVTNAFEGLRWAIENGAKVVSLSWGSYSSTTRTETEIVKTGYEQGVTIVAAAGNNIRNELFYPACLPYVISVGSVNSNKRYSSEFSNFGLWVDVLAPGGFVMRNMGGASVASDFSILSTTFCANQNYRLNGYSSLKGKYYDGFFGTSMATPITAGLCGLILSLDSTLSPHTVKELLTSTAEVFPENSGKVRDASGVINAFKALKALKNKLPMPYDFTYTVKIPGIEFTWKAPITEGTDLSVSYYRVYRNGVLVKDNHTGTSFSENNLVAGNYTYSVEAVFSNNKVSLKDGIDFVMPRYFTVDVEISPKAESGSVSGTGTFAAGDSVTLIATPTQGYAFQRWKEGEEIVGRDSILKIKLEYNVELTAVFKEGVSNELYSQDSELGVFPNPTRDIIYIDNIPEGMFSVNIYDLKSRMVSSSVVNGGVRVNISVSSLPKGQYILKVSEVGLNKAKTFTNKFSKI